MGTATETARGLYRPPRGGPGRGSRHFTITNEAAIERDIEFIYYGAFNIVDLDQFTVSPKFSAFWYLAHNDLLVGDDGSLTWTGPGWEDHPDGPFVALRLSGRTAEGAGPDITATGEIVSDTSGTGVFAHIEDGLLLWPTLTGFIPERHFGYGITGSGHPLLWPHSYLVMLEHTRSGEVAIPLAPYPRKGK